MGLPLLALYRCILGTMRVQFGNNSDTETREHHGDFGTEYT
jgi:hypothetical protein